MSTSSYEWGCISGSLTTSGSLMLTIGVFRVQPEWHMPFWLAGSLGALFLLLSGYARYKGKPPDA